MLQLPAKVSSHANQALGAMTFGPAVLLIKLISDHYYILSSCQESDRVQADT